MPFNNEATFSFIFSVLYSTLLVNIFFITFALDPKKGLFPVKQLYNITPHDQISADCPKYPVCLITSGAK